MHPEHTHLKEPKVVKLKGENTGYSIKNLPENEIWEEFKNGNEGAFNYIYTTYFQQVYQYGHQFSSDTGLIKDLLQDLLIDIRKNRRNLGEAPSIKFYLFKSFRRKIFRYMKSNKVIYSEDMCSFCNIIIESSYETKLVQSQLDEAKRNALQAAMLKLSNRQRECIYYYFFHSMTYKEVSSIMGLSNVKSARNLVYKSIDLLKAQIDPIKSKLLTLFSL